MTPKMHIQIRADYVPTQSSFTEDRYFFSYVVEIKNSEASEVRLLGRRWVLTDAEGKTQIIEGDGVVGAKPLISSGGLFSYSSCVLLKTPVGTMEGSYRFQRSDGSLFECSLHPICLADPFLLN